MLNKVVAGMVMLLLSSICYGDSGKKILVRTEKPEMMNLYDVYYIIGECKNTISKDINSKISGTITRITKKEGDFVKKGDVILSINYNNFEVIAPFDGQIGTIAYKLDQDVAAGDFLVSIISGDEKEIVFSVPERILSFMNKDAELYIQDSSRSALLAEIISKSPYLNKSGNSTMKARVVSPNLVHGSFIKGELRFNKHKGLVVKEYAVLKSSQGDYVYIKNSDNRAEKAFIKTGSRMNDGIEISGDKINGNTNIVVDGLTKIYESATLEEAEPNPNHKNKTSNK